MTALSITIHPGGGACLYCDGDGETGERYDDHRGRWVRCTECDGTGRTTCAVCDVRLEEGCVLTVNRTPVVFGDVGSEQAVCDTGDCVAKEIEAQLDDSRQRIGREVRAKTKSLESQLRESVRAAERARHARQQELGEVDR